MELDLGFAVSRRIKRSKQMMRQLAKRVAFISSCKPRKCGIATFTSDLIANIKLASDGEFEPVIIAVEGKDELEYSESVELRIRRDVTHDYIRAANYINLSDVDVVSVQHEFGLFGGEGGSYLNLLLGRLNKPVVTTLHTVLERPPVGYFYSLMDVCEASDKVVVMNKRGIKMLGNTYGLPKSKMELIPHGIPDNPDFWPAWQKQGHRGNAQSFADDSQSRPVSSLYCPGCDTSRGASQRRTIL
jgi:hypothetical protein